jgi:membrane protease YdiL (CAAX protease family)
VLFYKVSRVLFFYILSILVFATIAGVTKNSIYPNHISILISTSLTFVLVVIFTKWDKLTFREIGITFEKYSLPRFLSGFGIGFLMVLLQAVIVSNFAQVKFPLSANFSPLSVVSSLALYFLIACREELVFRSYALRNLANVMKPLIALSIITIIFILEHVIAGVSWKMSILGSGFGGVLFGLSALKTKGLALPLGLHFAWNFTQWLLGFKDNTGVWHEIVEKGNDQYAENVALIGFIVAMSISICGILIYYRRQNINGNH